VQDDEPRKATPNPDSVVAKDPDNTQCCVLAPTLTLPSVTTTKRSSIYERAIELSRLRKRSDSDGILPAGNPQYLAWASPTSPQKGVRTAAFDRLGIRAVSMTEEPRGTILSTLAAGLIAEQADFETRRWSEKLSGARSEVKEGQSREASTRTAYRANSKSYA